VGRREGGRERGQVRKQGREGGRGKKGKARTEPVDLIEVVVLVLVIQLVQAEPEDPMVDVTQPLQHHVLPAAHGAAFATDAHAERVEG